MGAVDTRRRGEGRQVRIGWSVNRGVWLLVRTDLRRRWSAVVVLSVLLGVAGAFVLTAATGARRADTSLPRLLDRTEMWDVAIDVDYPAFQDVMADVDTHPGVEAVGAFMFMPMAPGDDAVGVLAGLGGGWLDTVYRPRLIAGRLPASDQVAEVLVNEAMAERDGLSVGDSIVLRSFFGEDFVQSVNVVGIHRGIIDLALQDTGPEILATSAFGAFWGDRFYPVLAASDELGLVRPVVVAVVAGGPAEATAIVDDINTRRPEADASAQDTEGLLSAFEQGLSIQVEAFWLLTLVAGASGLLLLGSAMGRFIAGSTHPDHTLLALGLTARPRVATRLVPAVIAAGAGSMLAAVGAVLASPLVPLGSTRRVEPDPGIWIDPATLALGVLAVLVGVTGVAGVSATSYGRRRPARPAHGKGGVLPLWARLGRDFAYRGMVHGRTVLLATAVGVGLVVTVVVYSASLDRLLASPALFGSDFDVFVLPEEDDAGQQHLPDVDLDGPAIEAAGLSTLTLVLIGGQPSEAVVIEPLRGSAGGTVLSGRVPVAADEVGLGPGILERTGLDVGDVIVLTAHREQTMRIVGEVLVPAQGDSRDYSDGIWLSAAGGEFIDAEPGQTLLLLDLADGTAADELLGLIGSQILPVLVPDEVQNIDNTNGIPSALGIFGGALGAAVLGFGLAGIVRARQRDLAILHALGVDRRGLRTALAAAGIAIVVPGILLGSLGGIVVGRVAWTRVAGDVPTLVQPVVPLAGLALVALAALLVAGLAVAWPVRWAGGTDPSVILRQE